jgi:translation initiation factor IF-2
MRDTSEFTDATEQAKKLNPRSRNTARSKSESTAPSSQDQEVKSAAPRRRTQPTSHSTTGSRPQSGIDHTTNTPTSTPPRSSAYRSGGASGGQNNIGANTSPSGQGGMRHANGNAGHNPAGPRQVNTQRPGGAQPQQRQRSNAQNAAMAQPGNSTATAPRPNTRPGAPTATGNRSASTTNRSTTAPGSRGARPTTNRPATPAHRPQERRVAQVKEKLTGPISIPPQIVVKDLADLLQITPTELIKTLIKHGVFASINQVVEYDKAALAAKDLGFEPTQSNVSEIASQSDRRLSASEAMMASRNDGDTVVIPPVVAIMGHVDHGKTSLLDVIRKTKVAAGEAGGITQHIGAYQVDVNGKKITFLDTPGHEAFTAMRARGAQGAHIAIIVVAADDGVMPQTREAIDHARAAKVPIIIALNKIDKANANPDHVKQQLAEIGVVIEEYGGDVVCVPVSARKGEGIDELLEYIILVAELQDIRANPHRPATGVIIEAKLEKSSGPTATVLVQQGTLKMGDNFVVGTIAGKVRAMFNDRGKRIQKAPPSTPVSILGLPEVPQTGDQLEVVPDERTAKQRAQETEEKRRNENGQLGQVSLDTLYMQMQEGTVKELNVVLKSDVQGSSEAIKNALSKLGEDNLKVRLIREGIGNISETDVHLAAASGAIIIGFNVSADGAALREAQRENVDIRYYNVIYKLIDDIQAALVGMLEPTYREVIDGHAEVLQIFKAGKSIVAGCRVTDGKIVRSSHVRLLRKGEKVFDGLLASLRRGKDDVREIASGYECGIMLEDYNEIEIGDIIEAYSQERVKPGA